VIGLAAIGASAAHAARFKLSIAGTDRQDWTVSASPGPCVRTGGGRQTVTYRSTRPLTTTITSQTSRRAGRTIRSLFFTARGQRGYGVTLDGTGAVSRTDNTTQAPGAPDQDCRIFPRDCGRKSLNDPHNYRGDFADPGSKERFQLDVGSAANGALTLEGSFWASNESPFQNCIALRTPVEKGGESDAFWTGPQFGDQIWHWDKGPLTTARVPVGGLRVGRARRFSARKVYRLTIDPTGRGFFMDDTGDSGPPNIAASDSPATYVGSVRSVTVTTSWAITLRRIA
jgi:hypothetical protein